MSIPKIDITAPDESHAVAPMRRDPNLTMPGPDQWPAGVMACLKCEIVYDRGAGLRQRASFLTGGEREPVTMERSVEAAPEVGRFMYGPWRKGGCAESLAAGGEAKPERRGWVKARDRHCDVGAWIQNPIAGVGPVKLKIAHGPKHFNGDVQVWSGCQNPLCTREEPHETTDCRREDASGIAGVAQTASDTPDASKRNVVAGETRVQVRRGTIAIGARIPGGDVFPDDGAIHTEAQLARALFIAMNEAEVVRRCELREAGENVRNLLTERCRDVVTTMMADPAYASEREAAERLASRTWSARRVGL